MAEKLSITLPADMVVLIKDQVAAGRYASTSEVLREAMRTWMRQEEEHGERMKAIKARIAASLDDPRPSVPIDEAFTRIRASLSKNQTVS